MQRETQIKELLASPNNVSWLQGWYFAMCDGDWEHSYGPRISTLDNPGWTLEIVLQDTGLEDKVFTDIQIKRNEHDWVFCLVKDGVFYGAGGPLNLDELIGIFREWASPFINIRKHTDFKGDNDDTSRSYY